MKKLFLSTMFLLSIPTVQAMDYVSSVGSSDPERQRPVSKLPEPGSKESLWLNMCATVFLAENALRSAFNRQPSAADEQLPFTSMQAAEEEGQFQQPLDAMLDNAHNHNHACNHAHCTHSKQDPASSWSTGKTIGVVGLAVVAVGVTYKYGKAVVTKIADFVSSKTAQSSTTKTVNNAKQKETKTVIA